MASVPSYTTETTPSVQKSNEVTRDSIRIGESMCSISPTIRQEFQQLASEQRKFAEENKHRHSPKKEISPSSPDPHPKTEIVHGTVISTANDPFKFNSFHTVENENEYQPDGGYDTSGRHYSSDDFRSFPSHLRPPGVSTDEDISPQTNSLVSTIPLQSPQSRLFSHSTESNNKHHNPSTRLSYQSSIASDNVPFSPKRDDQVPFTQTRGTIKSQDGSGSIFDQIELVDVVSSDSDDKKKMGPIRTREELPIGAQSPLRGSIITPIVAINVSHTLSETSNAIPATIKGQVLRGSVVHHQSPRE